MRLFLDFSVKEKSLTASWVRSLAGCALETVKGKSFSGACELSAVFASDAQVRRLNRQYRGKDKTTDVLSFSQLEGKKLETGAVGRVILGDVVISLPQARRQAKQAGKTVKAETAMLLVHGILHLLGYDHGTRREEKRMFALQECIVRKFVTAQARQNHGQHGGTKTRRKAK